MCFSLQRRANFPQPNFQKCSDAEVFCTFWLATVLRATAACDFWTSELPKVLAECQFFGILTCKCASRHSGACLFSTSQLPKVLRRWGVLHIWTWKCASRHSGVPFFLSALSSYLRTRRFSERTFRPSRRTNPRKNTAFRDFPNISRRCMFFLWLSRDCIFFLLALLLFSAFHLLTLLLCSAFSTVHIVGS